MNFNQWRNYSAKGDVSKVTYVCGEETTLVELVIDDIKKILAVGIADYTTLDANQSDSIWDTASLFAVDPSSNRLTVVRNAENITDWSDLSDWLVVSRNNPKNFLVFVSSSSDAPAIYSKGKKVSYAEHIEIIRTKGKFIRCSTPNYEDMLKWCQSYGLTQDTSDALIQRTCGDTAELFSVLKKVHIWPGSPSKKALELFCQEQALDSLADYLILQDKKFALLALKSLPTEEYGKVISRLDSRLDYITDIHRCVIRRMYDADIAQTTGIKIFLVKKFKAVAKDYEYSKIKSRRQLITIIDSHLRSGAITGVMESLIILW